MIEGSFPFPVVMEYRIEFTPLRVSFNLEMAPSSSGESSAQSDDDFFEQVYDELRQLAHAKMAKEFKYSTLQGTALVHEAWLRLGADEQPKWHCSWW